MRSGGGCLIIILSGLAKARDSRLRHKPQARFRRLYGHRRRFHKGEERLQRLAKVMLRMTKSNCFHMIGRKSKPTVSIR